VKIILVLLLALVSYSVAAVNLQDYFPQVSGTVYLNKLNGEPHAKYTFTSAQAGFKSLYDQFLTINKLGHHYTWRKEYWVDGAWCTSTYTVMFMGDDLSITEVGDWFATTPCTPNVVFGYKLGGGNAGLIWAPPGGLTSTPVIVEALNTAVQNTPGATYTTNGYQAYSKVGIIEVLPEYTVPFGGGTGGVWAEDNGRTFQNVVHMVMYHGTRSPSSVTVRCQTLSPIAAYGAYYQSFKNYNSYAIELWLAPGIGIIQEDTPFIEDASYWGYSNCNGTLFKTPYKMSSFIR